MTDTATPVTVDTICTCDPERNCGPGQCKEGYIKQGKLCLPPPDSKPLGRFFTIDVHIDKWNFARKPFTAKLEIIENELANMLIKIFQDAEGYRVGENPNPKGKTYSEKSLKISIRHEKSIINNIENSLTKIREKHLKAALICNYDDMDFRRKRRQRNQFLKRRGIIRLKREDYQRFVRVTDRNFSIHLRMPRYFVLSETRVRQNCPEKGRYLFIQIIIFHILNNVFNITSKYNLKFFSYFTAVKWKVLNCSIFMLNFFDRPNISGTKMNSIENQFFILYKP